MHLRSDRFLRHFADEIVELKLIPNKSGTKITDAGLKAMTRLTSLDLTENDVISDEALNCLPADSLRKLIVRENSKITNACIARFTGLTSLNRRNDSLNLKIVNKNLNQLANLTNLTKLKLKCDDFFEYRTLHRLTALTNLEISFMGPILGTKRADYYSLQPLVNLTQLDLDSANASLVVFNI
jgi:hypothetical protein